MGRVLLGEDGFSFVGPGGGSSGCSFRRSIGSSVDREGAVLDRDMKSDMILQQRGYLLVDLVSK